VAFEHELRTRFGECDPQGIVFNPNYLAYFDVAVTELWREAFGSWQAMVDKGVDVVVGEANLRFKAPARADELVLTSTRLASLGTTSINFEMELRRNDTLLVEGRLRYVCVDAATWAKTEIPDWLRAGLERYAT
jgi:acyl-CoA thioester hydrolase